MRQHAGDHGRDRRTAGDVDDGFVFDDVGHRHRAGRIRFRIRDAAERSAGAHRDDGCRALDCLLQVIDETYSTVRAVPRIAHGYRPVDYDEVLAIVFLHRILARLLRAEAGSGLQRVVIIERDHVEDQALQRRRIRARQRLGATGAFLERQPDHRRPLGLDQCFGDRRCGAGRQRHQRGHRGAEFQERAAADALLRETFSQSVVFVHCCTSSLSCFFLKHSINPFALRYRRVNTLMYRLPFMVREPHHERKNHSAFLLVNQVPS